MALVLSVIHVLACILIIGVILLQSGKGGGMGAGFGGASAAATQLFGGRGAGNFLSRSTVGLAVVFMGTSLGLAYLSSRPNSLLDLGETSGREAPDEDTIVEEGSGALVELGADAAAPATPPTEGAPENNEELQKMQMDLQKMINEQLGGKGGNTNGAPMELKLNPADLGITPKPEGETAPAEVEAKPEEKPKPEAKPEPKPEPKPKPKPEAKPEPKPKPKPKPEAKPEPKPEPKPEAKPEPKPEAKPEAKPKPEPEPEAEEPAVEPDGDDESPTE